MKTPVRAFITSYTKTSRILHNEIHITFPSVSESGNNIKLPSNAKKYSAIWDTGATGTVVTKKVVEECGLKPIRRVKVYHAQGEATAPVYKADIYLPNKVLINSVNVVEGVVAGEAEVLIGMDIISLGDFAVTNKDEKTVFTFRLPSIERIDFTEQPSVPVRAKFKVGRNDPCPCGSGKKFKNCHGK